MKKLKYIANKIETLSLKNKIIIFGCLFVFSALWVTLRNPVYQDTTVYVFPIDDTGDGRIYYGIKNGYSKSLSFEIPQDSYYNHISGVKIDSLWVESSDGISDRKIIDIKDGINMYYLDGDILTLFPSGERFNIPAKNVRLLISKNGTSTNLYFSTLEYFYQKQLLNRDVAATFPFYIAYTANGSIAYDKSEIDKNLYDVSYERRQWFSDDYLDPVLEHHIAPNFRRSINFPYGYPNGEFSKKLILFSFLASLLLALFLFFVPFQLLKVFINNDSNKLLFIGLGIYLVLIFLLFRHSFYFAEDGQLMHVINLSYSAFFTHTYMMGEYIFYLIGYSSSVFLRLLLLCFIIWNYEKIIARYFTSNILKIIKYLLVIWPLVTPVVIAMTIHSRRDSALTWIILGYMFLARNRLLGGRKFMVASIICLLTGILFRIDFAILFIPVLIIKWLDNRSIKNTVLISATGLLVLVYAMVMGQGSNTDNSRVLANYAFMADQSILKHQDELTEQEKQIVSMAYEGGLDTLAATFSLVDGMRYTKGKKPLNNEDVNNFKNLTMSTILKYPAEYLNKIMYKIPSIYTRSTWPGIYPYVPGNSYSNFFADLPHKHNLAKLGMEFLMQKAGSQLYVSFSIFIFILLCSLSLYRLRVIGAISIGFLVYFVFMTCFSPAIYGWYFIIFAYWFYFMFGLLAAEIMHSNIVVKRSWVLPANIIIVLVFLALFIRDITSEYLAPVWNEQTALWERSITLNYPSYYRLFDKKIMVSSTAASKESMRYSLETQTKRGDKNNAEGIITPINRQVLEVMTIPASARTAKISFYTPDNDFWIDIKPRIDIRKHIYAALLFLFMVVNISLFRRNSLFIIGVRWLSTKNNHAGMFYLAKKIKSSFSGYVNIIMIPEINNFPKKWKLYRVINIVIAYYLLLAVKKGDAVFLMEYFYPGVFEESYFARKLHGKAKVIALAHLVPQRIVDCYTTDDIQKNISYINKLLVFGKSLSDFYIQKGIGQEKIITLLHYVDNKYHKLKYRIKKNEGRLVVIFMGNVERDYAMLLEIIKATPSIQYHVCRGLNASLDTQYTECFNVKLHKHIQEDELRNLMHESDVLLNVMNDTVGSNVIVTSLSCGLAIVCSDVGSIRDYVSPEAGILFNNAHEAVEGLQRLDKDRNMLHHLQIKSLEKAEEIDIVPFIKRLCEILVEKK
jgi:glycosyltransferase involved in cell wall biosynthesis